jgi:O-antigen/teichoic acid export membrane protein
MPSVAVNVIANWAGRGSNLVLNLVFLPVYLRLLGQERFGLIGFFGALQAVLTLVEFGLGLAFIRELARHGAVAADRDRLQDTVATLARIFLCLGLAVMVVVMVLAGPLSREWFRADRLDPATVRSSLRLMALLLALQFPASLFFSGLLGLQRQVLANALLIVLTIVRYGGAWIVLIALPPSIELFFAWHVVVHAVQAVLLRIAFDRSLPGTGRRGRCSVGAVRHLGSFTLAMGLMTFAQLVMWNADRLLMPRIFSLEVLGYYSLAGSIAGGILSLTTGWAQAIFPHLSQLLRPGAVPTEVLQRRYLELSDGVSVCLVPVGIGLAGLAPAVLVAWTGNHALALLAGPALAMLSLATMLRGCFIMPNQLACAGGRPGIAARRWLLFLAVYLAGGLALAMVIGPDGLPLGLLASVLVMDLSLLSAVHRQMLPAARRPWLVRGLLPKMAVCGGATLLAQQGYDDAWGRWTQGGYLLVLLGVNQVLAVAVSPGLWRLRHWWRRGPAPVAGPGGGT